MIEMQNAKFYLEVLNLCNFLPMTFYEDVQVDGSRNQIRRGNMCTFSICFSPFSLCFFLEMKQSEKFAL